VTPASWPTTSRTIAGCSSPEVPRARLATGGAQARVAPRRCRRRYRTGRLAPVVIARVGRDGVYRRLGWPRCPCAAWAIDSLWPASDGAAGGSGRRAGKTPARRTTRRDRPTRRRQPGVPARAGHPFLTGGARPGPRGRPRPASPTAASPTSLRRWRAGRWPDPGRRAPGASGCGGAPLSRGRGGWGW
jgi:hypothetical protein